MKIRRIVNEVKSTLIFTWDIDFLNNYENKQNER